jgi:hypothetical protein
MEQTLVLKKRNKTKTYRKKTNKHNNYTTQNKSEVDKRNTKMEQTLVKKNEKKKWKTKNQTNNKYTTQIQSNNTNQKQRNKKKM